MAEWLLYDVVLALLPVPLVILGNWLINIPSKLLAVIRDGQLCFFCTALGAVAIRDVTRVATPGQSITASLAGILFCFILATFIYGVAVVTAAAAPSVPPKGEWKLGLASVCLAITMTVLVAVVRSTMGLI